jgi:hypothetical protein
MTQDEEFKLDTLFLKVSKVANPIKMPLCELAIKGKLSKEKLVEGQLVISVPKEDSEETEDLAFSHAKFKTFLNQWLTKNVGEFGKCYGMVDDFVIQPEGENLLAGVYAFLEKYENKQ